MNMPTKEAVALWFVVAIVTIFKPLYGNEH